MATERQSPDTIADGSNYTSPSVGDIQDDPDSPDAAWLDWDGNGNTICRVTFPTPTGPPNVGADLQEFRVLIRNDAAGSNSTSWSLELWENGVLDSVLNTGSDPAEGGVVVSGTWNASSLGTADGSLVECRLIQTAGGSGSPTNRKGIEVGAVEWNVDYSGTTPVSNTMDTPLEAMASASQTGVVTIEASQGIPQTFIGVIEAPQGILQTAELSFEALAGFAFPYHTFHTQRAAMRAILTM